MNHRIFSTDINDICDDISLGLINERIVILDKQEEHDINDKFEIYTIIKNLKTVKNIEHIKTDKLDDYIEKYNHIFREVTKLTLLGTTTLSNLDIIYYSTYFEIIESNCNKNDVRFIENIIKYSENALLESLKHKKIVNMYKDIIKNELINNYSIAGKVIHDYYYNKNSQFIIPNTLADVELTNILSKYIENNKDDIFVIDDIAWARIVRNEPKIQITDELRYKARTLSNSFWKNSDRVVKFSASVPMPKIDIKIEKDDIKTLHNIFKHTGLVDEQTRLRSAGRKRFKVASDAAFYTRNGTFDINNVMFLCFYNLALMVIQDYNNELNKQNKTIEQLVENYFTSIVKEYLAIDQLEFKAPSKSCSIYEKNILLCSSIERLLKQYDIFARYERVPDDFLTTAYNQINIEKINSIIDSKYFYINDKSDKLIREMYLIFGEQSRLNTLTNGQKYGNAFEKYSNIDFCINNIPKYAVDDLNFLIDRGAVLEDGKNYRFYIPRLNILRDLYEHDVICRLSNLDQKILEELHTCGEITAESTLISRCENDVISFILNNQKFSNGLGIRNKYMHGAYSSNTDEQLYDYIHLIMILLLIVIKIDQELLYEQKYLLDPRPHDKISTLSE